MRHIPVSFARLVAAFPDRVRFPTPAFLNSIGGEVRSSVRDGDNTCAVRLSYTLNNAGAAVQRIPGDIYGARVHPTWTRRRHAKRTRGW